MHTHMHTEIKEGVKTELRLFSPVKGSEGFQNMGAQADSKAWRWEMV